MRFRGLVLAFDQLAKASTFVFNANSTNFMSEVSCSLSSFFVVAQVRDQLFQAMRNSEPRVRSVFLTDSILISTPYLPCR